MIFNICAGSYNGLDVNYKVCLDEVDFDRAIDLYLENDEYVWAFVELCGKTPCILCGVDPEKTSIELDSNVGLTTREQALIRLYCFLKTKIENLDIISICITRSCGGLNLCLKSSYELIGDVYQSKQSLIDTAKGFIKCYDLMKR